jgi:bifunctional DNase/RNase
LTVQELMRCSNGRAVLVLREKEGERRLLVPISPDEARSLDQRLRGQRVEAGNAKVQELATRPADAVALALEQGAPMFAAREVLDRAGITPEEAVALRDSRKPPAAAAHAGPSQVLDI